MSTLAPASPLSRRISHPLRYLHASDVAGALPLWARMLLRFVHGARRECSKRMPDLPRSHTSSEKLWRAPQQRPDVRAAKPGGAMIVVLSAHRYTAIMANTRSGLHGTAWTMLGGASERCTFSTVVHVHSTVRPKSRIVSHMSRISYVFIISSVYIRVMQYEAYTAERVCAQATISRRRQAGMDH